jgi:hypothetical protein
VPDPGLLSAVEEVWRILPPSPDSLLRHPAVKHLTDICTERYGGGARMGFSVLQLLRALGMPAGLKDKPEVALAASDAAERLERGLVATRALQRYLVPLDMADELPELVFGPARVGRFDRDQLAVLFDAERLARLYPNWPLDVARLTQFHWLVVEETVDLDPIPEKRSVPILFTDLRGDLGAFDPHHGRFPPVVERALFFLLLAPWEDWVSSLDADWRGFQTPWAYKVDFDIVASLMRPPDPDTLSWIEDSHPGRSGEDIYYERPLEYHTDEEAQEVLCKFDEAAWARCEAALGSPLFETPVVHFFIRGFLSDKIDEFMAHMTAIEAAVGSESDHRKKLRPKPDRHKKLFATDCVMSRIAALLGDVSAAGEYEELFQLRSEFVHGRRSIGLVSTHQRKTARRLARRLVAALVQHGCSPGATRESILFELLDQGAIMMGFEVTAAAP